MTKNKIQVIYAQNTKEIFSRRSALGSYIFCLSKLFIKCGYEIRINELELEKNSSQVPQEASPVSLAKRKFFLLLIPSFIKGVIKDIRLFNLQKKLYSDVEKHPDMDSILEFYTYGSDVGARLSEKYQKNLLLIYDNPVLEEHCFFNKGPFLFKRQIERHERKSILQAKAIIVYSDAVQNYLENKYQQKLPVRIHQNVDFTRFEFIEEKGIEDTINICFIGSFLKWHRVDLLINVFSRLKREHDAIKLYLLGNGMEFETIQQLVRQNEYHADIVLPGFVDGIDLLEYKKKMHIGVMPGSNWYGAPNKIFEYGAAQMAVIAPNTPTINYLFKDQEMLLLFKQDDEEELYLKLKTYITNISLLKNHAQTLQQKIKNTYSEKNTMEFYTKLF